MLTMNVELFEELLREGEGERVDFKEFNYDFSNPAKEIKDNAKASFLKDIFAFANTPRKHIRQSAYIFLGVNDNGEVVGLNKKIADFEFQNQLNALKKNLGKVPRIRYDNFNYKDKLVGIIEIYPPEDEKEPFIPKSNLTEKFKAEVLYFRADKNNSEAIGIDKIRIESWFLQCCQLYEKRKQLPIAEPLTNFPNLELKNIVGRKKEIEEIKTHLKQNSIVCISGISGLGKTTLANAYIIYVETDSSIQSALLSNEPLIKNLGLKNEFSNLSKAKEKLLKMDNITLERNDNELSHFALMINKLRSLPGENILIVDNVNSSVYAEISLLPTDNWNILLTSKEHIENENIHSYRLGHLAEEDAIALFKKHCKKKAEPKELKEFIIMLSLLN